MANVKEQAPKWLAGLPGGIGSLHFVVPDFMAQTVPSWVPAKKTVIYVSGVAEVACAVSLPAGQHVRGHLDERVRRDRHPAPRDEVRGGRPEGAEPAHREQPHRSPEPR